ncbi:predicted protein [Nematostella vectensis]|uniref:Ras-related protein Rab-24 n=2 Tax=Nematostella vectensis TaxID=45351 RepID=A7S0S1_NEMVE|nr:predicted protein [Nematostella vectensis]|eukprot:XP_001634850.1 predicted protein [Nematostella vectensis]
MNTFNFVESKVVLLGRNFSGKTCLLERYLHDRFLGTSEATIGAAYGTKTVTVRNTRVTLGIWDTAGSERYDAMSRIYYRGAKAAVICFDLTEEESFLRAKYWVNELHTYESSCRIYLCGTKFDLVEGKKKSRAVDAWVVSQYADGINAKLFETSSMTGRDVERLFFCVADDCGKEEYPQVEENDKELSKVKLEEPKNKRRNCCS